MERCEQFSELISAGLDGQLTAEEARGLEAHLAACPHCRALARELEAVHAAFPLLEEYEEAPEGFAQGVMDKIRAAESGKPKVVPLHKRPQVRALAGLAACALLCVGLYRGGMPRGDEQAGSGTAVPYALTQEEAMADSASIPGAPADAQDAPPVSVQRTGVPQADTETKARAQEEADQTQAPVLTLSAMPQGGEALLGAGVLWLTDGDGPAQCAITAEQAQALLKLAQEQGLDASLSGELSPAAPCTLALESR